MITKRIIKKERIYSTILVQVEKLRKKERKEKVEPPKTVSIRN